MNTNATNEKVLIGLSGGLDSAVAAALLKKNGYEVFAVLLRFWSNHNNNSINVDSYENNWENARNIARKLNIQYLEKDASKVFYKKVVVPFLNTYEEGKTPNPCVLCNPTVKWDQLIETADELNIDYISTGHYARKVHDENTGEFRLFRGRDKQKDQSYFLYRLDQAKLKRTLFPLGDFYKRDVNDIAKSIDLPLGSTRESQDLCFLSGGKLDGFLREHLPQSAFMEGHIITQNGDVIGKHSGLVKYTIGQRKKLGVSIGKPAYVIEMQKDKNRIVLGENEDLFSDELLAENCSWISQLVPSSKFQSNVQIRYKHKAAQATVIPMENKGCNVIFNKAQRAITPGQSAVFFDDDEILGGGFISAN
ncbi:tRNA 2-thiouridine(34) synthase MnmA [bacterium]|nr:tRNA 2-thiouridine(34) synthase MnmA [bacterium]